MSNTATSTTCTAMNSNAATVSNAAMGFAGSFSGFWHFTA